MIEINELIEYITKEIECVEYKDPINVCTNIAMCVRIPFVVTGIKVTVDKEIVKKYNLKYYEPEKEEEFNPPRIMKFKYGSHIMITSEAYKHYDVNLDKIIQISKFIEPILRDLDNGKIIHENRGINPDDKEPETWEEEMSQELGVPVGEIIYFIKDIDLRGEIKTC